MVNSLPTFTVFFTGNLLGNTPIDLAMAKFSQKFNLNKEQMRGLLEHSAKEHFPIKRSVPYEEAKKWEQHVEGCGFQCKIMPDSIEMQLGTSVFDEFEEKQNKMVITHWTTCPQCFKRQNGDNRYCEQCGMQMNY